jgi:hypothetical protein
LVYTVSDDTGAAAEGEVRSTETFGTGTRLERVFIPEGGYSTDLNLSLPKGSTVLSATFTVAGEPFVKNMPAAWWGGMKWVPPNATPDSYREEAFTGYNHSDCAVSDNVSHTVETNGTYPYQHFTFNVSVNPAQFLFMNVTWEDNSSS